MDAGNFVVFIVLHRKRHLVNLPYAPSQEPCNPRSGETIVSNLAIFFKMKQRQNLPQLCDSLTILVNSTDTRNIICWGGSILQEV